MLFAAIELKYATRVKITFVLLRGMTGGVKVVATYADRLTRRGHDVTVVSVPGQLAPLQRRLRNLVRGRGWEGKAQVHRSHLDGLDVRHVAFSRHRQITEADVPDADVVVATWWETAEWVASFGPRKGAKAYFIQHHEALFDGMPEERVRATYRLPLHKITISRWLVDLMRDEYQDPNVTHVPNSVDTEQFFAPPRGKQPHPTVGLLYSGTSFKGCAVSLKALAQARRELPDLRLVAFGAEPPRPDLPLPPGTTYVQAPAQDRIRDVYAQCDVWLCGSHAEGFHLPPLEAMACRCPVVSTAVGGPVDTITEGVNGRLVPVGDADALGRALVDVLRLPETQWCQMSDAAYATAAGFTWDQATDRFAAGLRRAIERRAELSDVSGRPGSPSTTQPPGRAQRVEVGLAGANG